jgi:hypothetical protein
MRISRRSRLLVAFVGALALSATAAYGAGRWKKAYFRATVPGAWARTQSVNTVNGDVSEYSSVRLADEDGKVVLETSYELKTGQFAGTKGRNRYVLGAGFPLESEGLSYMRGIVKGQASGPDGAEIDFDEATVRAIATGATDYGAIVVFKGKETLAGKACDHYAYTHGSGDQKVEGEYWLSDKVPFAAVKEVVSGTDATGARYRFETKLVESGVKAEIAKAAKAPRAAAPPVPTLAELWSAGKLSIRVDVLPGASKAEVTVSNSGEAPLDLVVPNGKTTLACGEPIGELVLVSDAERRLSVPAGEAAPTFELSVSGSRRPTKGSFTVSVHEGEPLFSGSVEMGR